MSHQLATQAARSTRHTAQVFRYSAIVIAGMASIGLTVAAGSYITNEMALQPGKLTAAAPATHPQLYRFGDTAIAPQADQTAPGTVGLAAFFGGQATQSPALYRIPATTPGPSTATAAEAPQPLAGQLRLGNTYVGAQLVPAHRDSLTFTVDTNVFAALADVLLHTPLGEQLGIASDPSVNTRLRTDVDTHGNVTVTFDDPSIGTYDVQIARQPVYTPDTTATV